MFGDSEKSDKKLKKEKEKLENQKKFLEDKVEIKNYLAWNTMPYLEQALVRQDWDSYYKKINKTTSYREYFEMRDFWKSGKMEKVQKLAEKARKRLEDQAWEVPVRGGIDPWDFSHGIYSKYDFICHRIRQINKELTGLEDMDELFNQD